MEAAPVIKGFDEIEVGLASFAAGLEAAPTDRFVFEGAPEGFHGAMSQAERTSWVSMFGSMAQPTIRRL